MHKSIRSEAIFADQGILSDDGQTLGNEQDVVVSSTSRLSSLVDLLVAEFKSRFYRPTAGNEKKESFEDPPTHTN